MMISLIFSEIITTSNFVWCAICICRLGLGSWGTLTTWNVTWHFLSFGLPAQVFDKEALKVLYKSTRRCHMSCSMFDTPIVAYWFLLLPMNILVFSQCISLTFHSCVRFVKAIESKCPVDRSFSTSPAWQLTQPQDSKHVKHVPRGVDLLKGYQDIGLYWMLLFHG